MVKSSTSKAATLINLAIMNSNWHCYNAINVAWQLGTALIPSRYGSR